MGEVAEDTSSSLQIIALSIEQQIELKIKSYHLQKSNKNSILIIIFSKWSFFA